MLPVSAGSVRGRSATAPLTLCYHAISSTWTSSLAVPAELLSRHIDFLVGRGYVGLTLTQAERLRRRSLLPRRSVVVTFDDAFASVVQARPLLEAAGLPATVFAVTRACEEGSLSWPELDRWRPAFAYELRSLSWDELASLSDRGWEIGSHTCSHPRLTSLDDVVLERELLASRTEIAERLGSCTAIAYPFGVADERVARAASRAGYEVGCTLSRAHIVDEPLRRPRVGIYPNDRGWRQRAKLSTRALALRGSRLAGALDVWTGRRRGIPEPGPQARQGVA